MPLAPAEWDSAMAWAGATAPRRHTLIRFRGKAGDAGKAYAGRAAGRGAPPDSLRIDYAGPFNWGAGAALVVGDTTVWADPEKNFRSLVPAVRMLWAGLGIVRPPAVGAAVFGLVGGGPGAGSGRVWRVGRGGGTRGWSAGRGGTPSAKHRRGEQRRRRGAWACSPLRSRRAAHVPGGAGTHRCDAAPGIDHRRRRDPGPA